MNGPSKVISWLDEHPDSINDAIFYENAGCVAGQEKWEDLPASHHNSAGSFSFADGHSEIHRRSKNRAAPIYYKIYGLRIRITANQPGRKRQSA